MGPEQRPETGDGATGKHEEGRDGGGERRFVEETAEAHLTDNPRTTAPPSPSASLSPDFSFTVSILSSPAPAPDHKDSFRRTPPLPPSCAAALDLSPADDIFSDGHLLPLHLLSHLPAPPRSSTNSIDSFALHATDSSPPDPRKLLKNGTVAGTRGGCGGAISNDDGFGTKERVRPRPFSLFGLAMGRKGPEAKRGGEEEEKPRRKSRFEVGRVVKRYVAMARPLLLLRHRGKEGGAPPQVRRQAFSFSGNLSPPRRFDAKLGRRGEFSAPASMRVSPTNSGLLLATAAATLPSSAGDSSMEELQAAIQAAIAHCKSSISGDDNLMGSGGE